MESSAILMPIKSCYTHSMRKHIYKAKVWITDWTHLVKNMTIMYFRHTPPKHYLSYTIEGKVPVIILPGIFGRWSFLKPLADHISLLGHPVYIVPKLRDNLHDIPTSAKMLREVILENNLTHVVAVAHSKGGLITKYMLAHDNADYRTKGLVAIATPFSGSNLGNYIPYYPARELATDSKIIAYLQTHTQVNKQIISIIPQYDNFVWHEKGSFLEGALENIYVLSSGHNLLLRDTRVWKVVLQAIDTFTKQKNT